ncbi:MAG TPA: GNAT family protein [Bacillales bacterium]|nr:GNAT family protein [Bacillales bacterium]
MMEMNVNDNIKIQTIDSREAKALYQRIEKNKKRLQRWIEWTNHVESEEDLVRLIRKWTHPDTIEQGYHLGIYVDGKIIGMIGFTDINFFAGSAQLSYWLDKEHEGKGIMSRSCERMIAFLFGQLPLNRVEIRVATGNVKSCAIPERLGFRLEGRLRQVERVCGQLLDNDVYGLLKQEYEASSGKMISKT